MDMVDAIYAMEYQRRAARASGLAMRFRLLAVNTFPDRRGEFTRKSNRYATRAAGHYRNARRRMELES